MYLHPRTTSLSSMVSTLGRCQQNDKQLLDSFSSVFVCIFMDVNTHLDLVAFHGPITSFYCS